MFYVKSDVLFHCNEIQEIISVWVEISSCSAGGSTQFPNDQVKSRIFWEVLGMIGIRVIPDQSMGDSKKYPSLSPLMRFVVRATVISSGL